MTPQIFSIAIRGRDASVQDQQSDFAVMAAPTFPACSESFFVSYLRAIDGQQGGTVDTLTAMRRRFPSGRLGVETLEFELKAQLDSPRETSFRYCRNRFVLMGAGRLEELLEGYRLDEPANTLCVRGHAGVDRSSTGWRRLASETAEPVEDDQGSRVAVSGRRRAPAPARGAPDGPAMGAIATLPGATTTHERRTYRRRVPTTYDASCWPSVRCCLRSPGVALSTRPGALAGEGNGDPRGPEGLGTRVEGSRMSGLPRR